MLPRNVNLGMRIMAGGTISGEAVNRKCSNIATLTYGNSSSSLNITAGGSVNLSWATDSTYPNTVIGYDVPAATPPKTIQHEAIFKMVEQGRITPEEGNMLLEAMEERQITIERESIVLPRPFIVIATQNPIELEGTYPLPEAQMDRFLFKVVIGAPKPDELREILNRTTGAVTYHPQSIFEPRHAPAKIEELKLLVREVMVAQPIEHYAARMVRATQPSSSRYIGQQTNGLRVDAVDRYVSFGASPRGAQALIMGAKVRALLDGRANVAYEDIDQVAPAALQHRVMLNYAAHSDGIDAAHVVDRVIQAVRPARA